MSWLQRAVLRQCLKYVRNIQWSAVKILERFYLYRVGSLFKSNWDFCSWIMHRSMQRFHTAARCLCIFTNYTKKTGSAKPHVGLVKRRAAKVYETLAKIFTILWPVYKMTWQKTQLLTVKLKEFFDNWNDLKQDLWYVIVTLFHMIHKIKALHSESVDVLLLRDFDDSLEEYFNEQRNTSCH